MADKKRNKPLDIQSSISTIKQVVKATQGLSQAQITFQLTRLPRQKVEASKLVHSSRSKLQQAEFDLKRVMAKQQMIAVAKKEVLELSSDADRKAWVLEQKEVIEAEMALIQARADHEAAKVIWGYFDDMFTSVRKQATLIEKQLDTQAQYAK